jgi:LysM domain
MLVGTNPDYFLPDYFIRTPARLPNIPFAYTVHNGDAMSNLAHRYEVSLEALEGLNSQISDQDRIFPTAIIRSQATFRSKVH